MKRIASLLLVLLLCLSSTALAFTVTETNMTLPALLEKGYIKVEIIGDSINWTTVKITNTLPLDLEIEIGLGLYFQPASKNVQPMLVTESVTANVAAGATKLVDVPTACMNIELDIPDDTNGFTLMQLPEDSLLWKAIAICYEEDLPYAVQQAVVWMITDNADFEDLGVLESGGVRYITKAHNDVALSVVKRAKAL